MLQDALDAPLRTVSVVDINLYHALPFAVFDDLHVRQRTRNAVAHVGKAPAVPLPTGTISLPKNLESIRNCV